MSDFSIEIAIYLICFASLHSFLASLRAKAIAMNLFGARAAKWYPVFFSAVAVLTIVPLVLLLIKYPGRMLYRVPAPWFWLVVATQLLIGFGSLRAFLDAPHRFLIQAQLAEPASPEAFPLGIKGIYCWIRDPFLLSGLLMIWLMPLMTTNLLAVCSLATLYLFLGSLHWETRLIRQFGEAYILYQKKVPRMIPRVSRKWHDCQLE